MLIPTGFWSYTTSDDTNSRGKLSQLRALLAAELQQQVGRSPKVNIFQDVVAIPPGREWDRQIRKAIEDASFIIPIITPGFLQSEWCCREVELFRQREEQLGVQGLVFPLHYVDVSHIDRTDTNQCQNPHVLAFLRTRQWTDFRPLRLRSHDSEEVSLLLESLARGILRALRDASLERQRAEDKRRADEEEAARRAEAQLHGDLAEAARLIQQKREVEEAERLAEETRLRKEAEDAHQADLRRHREEDKAAALAERTRLRQSRREALQAKLRFMRSFRNRKTSIFIGATVGLILLGGSIFASRPASVATTPSNAPDKTADSSSADEMFKRGNAYLYGQGVPPDYAKAVEWYEKGAAAGSAAAMYDLGSLYQNGQGVAQDYAQARGWYEKGAAAGSANSMESLSILYKNGLGGPNDAVKANEWHAKYSAAQEK